MSDTQNEEFDSEFFSEAVADAKTIRETAIENAKDHLEEAFTPKLQSMLSQTIQQEMEGEEKEAPEMDGEEEMEDEEELELDLSDLEDEEEGEEEQEGEEEDSEEEASDEEEDMEEITDQEELDLESVMEFLEAASMDDRHSDPDTSDDLSDDNVTYDDEMLDTGEYEDGNTQSNQSAIMDDVQKIAQELEEETELQEELEDEVVEAFLDVLDEEEHEEEEEEMEDEEHMDETVFDVDLNEFGVTSTDREPMEGLADVSGPYDTETDPNIDAEAGEGVDVGGEEYDPEAPGLGTGGESGTEDLDQPINTDNLYEENEYDLSALLEDDADTMNEAAELREENQELKEELQKHRQAIKILREKINETNLINSKLLYTNRLFKEFGLNDRQKMKVIESFDRASNTREAKVIFTTLAENLNEQKGGSSSEQVNESRKSGKKDKLVEALQGGLSSEKTGGSSTPSEDQKQILNENSDLKNRFQKLADLK
jgi:hypothetical protein